MSSLSTEWQGTLNPQGCTGDSLLTGLALTLRLCPPDAQETLAWDRKLLEKAKQVLGFVVGSAWRPNPEWSLGNPKPHPLC